MKTKIDSLAEIAQELGAKPHLFKNAINELIQLKKIYINEEDIKQKLCGIIYNELSYKYSEKIKQFALGVIDIASENDIRNQRTKHTIINQFEFAIICL